MQLAKVLSPSNLLIEVLLAIVLATINVGIATPAELVDPWNVFMTMPQPITAIHDLTAFTDPADGDEKLAIATGFIQGAPILFWDPQTQLLTTAFQAPLDTYGGSPYWRSLLPFKGKLYAGLGNNNHDPTGSTHTGQVWQYDGIQWSLVLSTQRNDTYTLCVYNNRLYAGVGTFGSQSGQLWVTSDGTTWTMLKQFSADYVRSLAVFQHKLYIGLRKRADLWTYDGTKFVEIGPPPTMTGPVSQVKTLVVSPDGSLLYVGGVPAYIYTWDGSAYTLSLDVHTTDLEIYKGVTYQGDVFFPTHASQNNGQSGNIYRLDNNAWSLEYSTPVGQAQLQIVRPFHGYLYVSGDGGRGPDLLRAQYK